MSLFKVNTFWSSSPVWQEEENFDFNAFCVNKFAADSTSKVGSILITGSYQGVLRIYCPTYEREGAEETDPETERGQDLLLEMLLSNSILQVCIHYIYVNSP